METRTIKPLTRRLCEGALGLYGLRDAHLEPLVGGFVEVYLVRTADGEDFVLRLYGLSHVDEAAMREDPRLRTGPGLRSPDTIHAQLSWVASLGRETGLLVPEPMLTSEGSLVGRVSVEGMQTERHCALLRWVPGLHRAKDPSPEDLSLLGSFVARMHDHSERHPLPEPVALPRWDHSWPFGDSAPLWDEGQRFYSEEDMGVFVETARHSKEILEELGEGADVFGVIHRDLKLDNVVFHRGKAGVLDFDACGLGHYLLDLCRVRRNLTSTHPNRLRELWNAFMGGYEATRPLPEGHRGYFGTFAAIQTVAAVNRQVALLATGGPRKKTRDPRFLSNAVGLLKRMSANWALLPLGMQELPYKLGAVIGAA
ncbi:MAG TPA: phosphotransferase [Rubrobacter sp.]|nr:phosphotransferase [Rubrobacter sp.]